MSWLVATAAIAGLTTAAAPSDRYSAQARAREFMVVVNSANPLTTIAKDQLSRIFMKRVATWPDGKAAEPVDLPTSDGVRIAFTKTVHGKSVGAVRAFWQQQIFSGRDVPPPEKANAAEVIEFVSTHVGAVGYVPASATLAAGTKAIALEGESP
jgi:ABC-type phosphate transport system substrate-binding protein